MSPRVYVGSQGRGGFYNRRVGASKSSAGRHHECAHDQHRGQDKSNDSAKLFLAHNYLPRLRSYLIMIANLMPTHESRSVIDLRLSCSFIAYD